jgi:FkbM family methyltransferase
VTIETNSSRLAWVARACRMFPPAVSGVFLRLYPASRARREKTRFVARSSLANVTFSNDAPDWVAMNFAIRGFYEWLNVAIANIVAKPGDCIVEVGANIGTETILFARIVGDRGQVVSFEPLPSNVAALASNIARNQLTNVRVINAAVSDRPGTLRFEPPQTAENLGQGRVTLNGGGDGLLEVPAVVLDELFERGELAAPRLLVIDVQGAELMVLRGARRLLARAKPLIIWEAEEELLTSFGARACDLFDLLSRLGYRHWEITKFGLREIRGTPAAQYNCLSIPGDDAGRCGTLAAHITARLRRAAWLPLIPRLNPAVIVNGR